MGLSVCIRTAKRFFIIFLSIKDLVNHIVSKERHLLTPLVIGFILSWVVFLVNEYKVNLLAMVNYHMICWILFGFSNALTNTIKQHKRIW